MLRYLNIIISFSDHFNLDSNSNLYRMSPDVSSRDNTIPMGIIRNSKTSGAGQLRKYDSQFKSNKEGSIRKRSDVGAATSTVAARTSSSLPPASSSTSVANHIVIIVYQTVSYNFTVMAIFRNSNNYLIPESELQFTVLFSTFFLFSLQYVSDID